jgi:hypothetical protein
MTKLLTFMAMALVGFVISGCGSYADSSAAIKPDEGAPAEQSADETEDALDEDFAFPDIEKAADPEKAEPENVAYGTRRTERTRNQNLDPAARLDDDDDEE